MNGGDSLRRLSFARSYPQRCRRCKGASPPDGSPSRCNGTGYACHAPNITEAEANGWRDQELCDSLTCERSGNHAAHDNYASSPAWKLVAFHNIAAMVIEQVARNLGKRT